MNRNVKKILVISINMHLVYFKKISAAPFGNRSLQLRGAWVCTWAVLQILQGGASPPHKTETRWTEKERFFVSLPFLWGFLISVDSYAECGWPDTLGTIQGVYHTDLYWGRFWVTRKQKKSTKKNCKKKYSKSKILLKKY